MNRLLFPVPALLLACIAPACGDDDTQVASPLVSDPEAVITVKVVQSLDPDENVPEDMPVEIYNLTGDFVVATANAAPRVVPISFGEPDADPLADFLLVQVLIDSEFVDDIFQVELRIDVGSTGTVDWCEPMDQDPMDDGGFFLKLQPACDPEERDPLTGQCTISGTCEGYSKGCREDRLTFTLWDDISSVCHEQMDDNQ